MASSMILTLIALVVPMVCPASIKRHTLKIAEKGALFNQAINVDVKNQNVYIHVPAHRDVPEARFMYEFTTGRLLRCVPSVQRCFLSNFNTQTTPGARREEHDLLQFARKRTTPRKEEDSETVNWQDMVVTERIQNTAFLTKRMRQVLGNHALYREEPLPKGAEIMTGQLDLATYRQESKRQSFMECNGNGKPTEKYAYGHRDKSCNYMVWCTDRNDSSTCTLDHHGRRTIFRCLCCPEATSPTDCKCFSLT